MKYLPFFLWVLVIIGVTSFPLKIVPQVEIFGMDKLFHFFLFSVLILFFFLGFGKKNWKFLIFIVLFAGLSEVCQHFVPGRIMNVYDFLFNLSGVGIAYWVLT